MAGTGREVGCGLSRRKAFQSVTFCVKKERNASFKKVTTILQKPEEDRTEEEKEVLFSCSDLVKEVTQRIERRKRVKDRLLEIQDPEDVLEEKSRTLAEALANSKHLVVYTGAGISTSACIPDYRGTNGIWTLLQQGKDIGLHDLTQAEPTRTHMALSELHKVKILRHVVSQNCDGLHLRSGLPKCALSEVHGNMYIEVCRSCKREYWRLFDVTENTARYSHRTMRRCYRCSKPLHDTIVHFGERGTLQWPLNWPGASQGADKADVILCIGSSLKVLKKYPWLWGMDKPAKKRPKLYIINLQWTPKDDCAVLKISGKCDEVMEKVMGHLNLSIPRYDREHDPIFSHATLLNTLEEHTRSQPNLKLPASIKTESSTLEVEDYKLRVGTCSTSGNDTESKYFQSCSVEVSTLQHSSSENFLQFVKTKCEAQPEDLSAMETDTFNSIGSEGGFGYLSELSESPRAECHLFPVEKYLPISNPITLAPLILPAGESFLMEHNYSRHKIEPKHLAHIELKVEEAEYIEIKAKGITHLSPHHSSGSREVLSSGYKESTNTSSNPQRLIRSTRSQKLYTPMCSFCDLNHLAQNCLYYSKYDSTFAALDKCAAGVTVPICECCDIEDDEDDTEEEANDNSNVKEEKPEGAEEVNKVPIINPGWYGKGYRKRIRKKR